CDAVARNRCQYFATDPALALRTGRNVVNSASLGSKRSCKGAFWNRLRILANISTICEGMLMSRLRLYFQFFAVSICRYTLDCAIDTYEQKT
ncbi:MAG: hypothetical protein VX622_06580, partial [Pseudomonadota bacterium]|nr:hypothetical protein [Pseudomonadota bacterium]